MAYRTYTCPIAQDCGGCELLAVPYPIQLKRKQSEVERLFEDVLQADDTELFAILGMDEDWGGEPLAFRFKAATPFAPLSRRERSDRARKVAGRNKALAKGGSKKGAPDHKLLPPRIASGFYARGTHRIIPCESCLVEAPRARETLNAVARVASELHIPAYDEDSGKGSLRHAVVRMGYASRDCMLIVVANGKHLAHEEEFLAHMLVEAPWVSTIVLNSNTRKTNAILGKESRALYGDGFMHDSLLGCEFLIGPQSFYQTNPAQTEALYSIAIERAGLHRGSLMLDAYCGVGTIGICAAARTGARVHGVEVVKDAVYSARANAELNHLDDRCTFTCADAGEFMRKAAKRGERYDAVVMDPPRAGASEEFLESLVQLAPRRIVYVSCNPETQARDVEHLRRAGYRLMELHPVDMFPHTKHVESVALLTRAKR